MQFTWQHFLDSIIEGKVIVEDYGDQWNVYDDKEFGTELTFPKNGSSTKEEALKQAKFLTLKQMNALKERVKLNERLKCPFCYYQGKISLIDQWDGTEDYLCSEGHNFSIVLNHIKKQ